MYIYCSLHICYTSLHTSVQKQKTATFICYAFVIYVPATNVVMLCHIYSRCVNYLTSINGEVCQYILYIWTHPCGQECCTQKIMTTTMTMQPAFISWVCHWATQPKTSIIQAFQKYKHHNFNYKITGQMLSKYNPNFSIHCKCMWPSYNVTFSLASYIKILHISNCKTQGL